MILTNITGLAGWAFALTILMMFVFKIVKKPLLQTLEVPKWVYWALLMLVMLIPFIDKLSFAGYMRGYMGDLSITSLILLSTLLWRVNPLYTQQHQSTMIFIAIGALLFYPFALGLGIFDPYRLGFGHSGFILSLLCITLWCLYRHKILIAICIICAVLAWSAHWYESDNLWDYLLDPWVSVYAIALLVKRLFSFILLKRRTSTKILS